MTAAIRCARLNSKHGHAVNGYTTRDLTFSSIFPPTLPSLVNCLPTLPSSSKSELGLVSCEMRVEQHAQSRHAIASAHQATLSVVPYLIDLAADLHTQQHQSRTNMEEMESHMERQSAAHSCS